MELWYAAVAIVMFTLHSTNPVRESRSGPWWHGRPTLAFQLTKSMPFTIQRFLKVSITAKRVTLGHGNDCSPDLDYAFQALAIDENRITFPPTLWHKTADGPAKDLQQCWFPGVHSNIGGGAGVRRSNWERLAMLHLRGWLALLIC